jgi:hypothetical protein
MVPRCPFIAILLEVEEKKEKEGRGVEGKGRKRPKACFRRNRGRFHFWAKGG